ISYQIGAASSTIIEARSGDSGVECSLSAISDSPRFLSRNRMVRIVLAFQLCKAERRVFPFRPAYVATSSYDHGLASRPFDNSAPETSGPAPDPRQTTS